MCLLFVSETSSFSGDLSYQEGAAVYVFSVLFSCLFTLVILYQFNL